MKYKTKWSIRFAGKPCGFSWFYSEWNFTNRFGVYERGIRILGFEVCNWFDDYIQECS